jgi:hypothetical protein
LRSPVSSADTHWQQEQLVCAGPTAWQAFLLEFGTRSAEAQGWLRRARLRRTNLTRPASSGLYGARQKGERSPLVWRKLGIAECTS